MLIDRRKQRDARRGPNRWWLGSGHRHTLRIRLRSADRQCPHVESRMTDRKNFLLRLNPRLHRVLEQWATDDMRSLNAQIEFLLTDAARRAGRLKEEAIRMMAKGES